MVWDGTTWEEFDRQEQGGKDPSASVTYRGPWSERIDFAMGYYGRLRFGGWVAPALYGPLGIYCQAWSAKPFGQKGDGEDWSIAEVVVNFGTNNDEPTNDNGEPADVGDEKFTIAGTTVNLPPAMFKWLGGEKNSQYLKEDGDITPFKVIPEIGYTISFSWITDFDPDKVATYVGKINSTSIGVKKKVAAGRVMFLGAESSRRLTAEGIKHWKVDYNYSIKGVGQNWNKFWDGSSWQFIGHGSDNTYVYEESDLTAMLPS